MAIRDKDGSVYQLRGPNPLLQNQREWDRSQIVLLNCGWKGEVVEDVRSPVKESRANVRDIAEELSLKPNAAFVPASQFVAEAAAPPKGPVNIDVDERLGRILKERGVQYHCAPVVGYRSRRDPVYDSVTETPAYGEPYTFDAVVVSESDFQLQFWCVRAVSKHSVVYRKAGGAKLDGRWWRVDDVAPKTGGFLVLANLSDVSPDFSA